MKLTKTNYLTYRDCAHNAWVQMHRPDIYNAQPLSEFDEARDGTSTSLAAVSSLTESS